MNRDRILKSLLSLLTVLGLLACFGALAEDEPGRELKYPDGIAIDSYVLTGESVKLTLESIEHAAKYTVTVRDAEDAWVPVYTAEYTEAAAIAIPASAFARTGIWPVRVKIDGEEGWEGTEWEGYVYVTDDAPASTGVTFVTSKTTVPVGDDSLLLWAYAPGAESIEIAFDNGAVYFDGESGAFPIWYAVVEEEKLYAVAHYANGEKVVSDPITITSTAAGRIEGFEPEIPDTVEANEDLVVVVPKAGNASSITDTIEYNAYVWDMTEEYVVEAGHWQSRYNPADDEDEVELLGDGQTLTVEADRLIPGRNYRVWAWAIAPGYIQSYHIKSVVVLNGVNEDIALTVNGASEGTVEVDAHESYSIHIDLPENVTALRLFDGDDYQYLNWRGEWGDWKENRAVDLEWDKEGDGSGYSVYAQPYYGEVDEETDYEQLNWSEPITNVVMVKTYENGYVGYPVVSLVNDTVERGDFVEFNIDDYGEDAEWVWIYAAAGEDEFYGDDFRKDSGAQKGFFSTARLEPGSYRLVVGSYATGKSGRQRTLFFDVVEPEEQKDVYFSVSKTDVMADEDFELSAYAPGANLMETVLYHDDGDVEYDWCDEDGEALAERRSIDESGEYTLVVQAWYYDEERQEDYCVTSDPVRVNVTALGACEAPVIEGAHLIAAGEDYSFTVSGLEQGADYWWDVQVYDKDDDWNEVARWNSGNSDILEGYSVSAGELTAGHRYHIDVWVDAYASDGAGSEFDFYVYDEVDENITLRLNGSDTAITAEVRETVRFEAVAPGAMDFLVYNGDYWRELGRFENEDGRYVWEEEIDPENTCYIVRAAYEDSYDWEAMDGEDFDWDEFDWENDIDWGGVSNAVTVDVLCYGEADVPVVTGLPEVVTRGDVLTLTIESAGDEDSPSRGRFFHLYFRDQDGEDYDAGGWGDNDIDPPVTVNLYTAELPAGENYTLMAASGALGYTWGHSMYTFDVVEPEGDAFAFDISAGETVTVNEGFNVSIYKKDAGWLEYHMLCADYDEVHEYGGDWFVGEHCFDDPGEFDVYAIAHFVDEAGNETREPEESAHYHVTSVSLGELDAPVVRGSATAQAGEDYVFSVENLHQVEENWYDIDVHDEDYPWPDDYDGEEDLPLIWRGTLDDYGDERSEFIIPGDALTAGHRYRIHVWVDAAGYNGADSDFTFVAYGAVDEDLTVKVNGSETEAEALSHEDFDITIAWTGDVEAIRFFNGNDWDYCWDFEPGTRELSFGRSFDKGEYVVFAQACRDDIDWDAPEFDWNDQNWGGISRNTVKLTVNSLGEADPAVVEAPESVERGRLLNVRILSAGDADSESRGTNFHAYIVDDEYNWDGSNDAFFGGVELDQFPLEFTLSTGYLDPEGSYRLIVDSSTVGYEWTGVEYPITVTEPENDFIFEIETTELTANYDYRVSAYARGAAWLDVIAHHVEDGEDTERDERWEGYPGEHVNGSVALDEGEYELYAIAHYADEDDNETGTRESDPITIYVNYIDDLPEPRIIGSGTVRAGEDFAFSVENLHIAGDNWYSIDVHDDDYQWPEDYEGEDDLSQVWFVDRNQRGDEATEFTIPGELLSAGHSYSMWAWIDKEGFRGNSSEFRFYVYDEADENVSITINGGDHADLQACEEATIRISAPGATAVEFWNGWNWELLGELDSDTGAAEFSYEWSGNTTLSLLARATYQEIDWEEFDGDASGFAWGGISNAVTVTVTVNGWAGVPEVEILNDPVQRGEMLKVRINSAENATRVDLSIFREDGEEGGLSWRRYEDVAFPFEAALQTAGLEPGRYHLDVSASAVGYGWSGTPWEELWFEIVEPERSITVSVDKTSADLGEEIRFSVYAPGAEEVSIAVTDGEGYDEENVVEERYYDGESVDDSFGIWWDGDFVAFAYARYPGQDDWVRSETELAIHINGGEPLPQPVVRLEKNILMDGESIRFSFDAIDGIDWYKLTLHDTSSGNEIANYDLSRAGTWTVAPHMVYGEIETGKVYCLQISIWKQGREPGWSDENVRFAVVDPGRILVLPSALTAIDDEAFENTAAQLIVLPDGITSDDIGARAFANSESLTAVVGRNIDASIDDRFAGSANRIIIANDY